MRPAHAREVLVVLVHLAFWSQLGVLTRIYLDLLFSIGCTGGWGLCLTSAGACLGMTDSATQLSYPCAVRTVHAQPCFAACRAVPSQPGGVLPRPGLQHAGLIPHGHACGILDLGPAREEGCGHPAAGQRLAGADRHA